MRMRRWAIVMVAMMGLAGTAACGENADGADGRDIARAADTEPAGDDGNDDGNGSESGEGTDGDGTEDSATVRLTSLDGRRVLTDAKGRALYLFTKDRPSKSNCVDDCLAAWPALDGPAKAGKGVDADRLGSITRPEGGEQVTYDGRPLYYFAKDKRPGDTFGQGVKGVWFLVDARGKAVGAGAEEKPAAPASVRLGTLNGERALTDGAGRALYVFAKDRPNVSKCVDTTCRTTWPVLKGPVKAGPGIDAERLGTITRADGTAQVTYAGKPLYYHVRDKQPGDILGNGFKGLWCLVDVEGKAIKE